MNNAAMPFSQCNSVSGFILGNACCITLLASLWGAFFSSRKNVSHEQCNNECLLVNLTVCLAPYSAMHAALKDQQNMVVFMGSGCCPVVKGQKINKKKIPGLLPSPGNFFKLKKCQPWTVQQSLLVNLTVCPAPYLAMHATLLYQQVYGEQCFYKQKKVSHEQCNNECLLVNLAVCLAPYSAMHTALKDQQDMVVYMGSSCSPVVRGEKINEKTKRSQVCSPARPKCSSTFCAFLPNHLEEFSTFTFPKCTLL